MRNRIIQAAFWLAILALCASPSPVRTHAHQDKHPPVNQSWHIVADIPPAHLEDELKKLNAAGYTVSKNDIVVAGDKFTVILDADQDAADDDDDEGRRDK